MRASHIIRPLLSTALTLCLSVAGFTVYAADGEDPPDRVARLSYMRGDVSLKPAGVDEWTGAVLNRPLTTDDQLWIDRDARAELQVGTVNIHLDSGTAFSFTDLSDAALQMRLTDGALHLNIRRLYEGEIIEVDTPHAAVVFTKPGDYRVEVLGDDRTRVKTYSGEAEVTGAREPVLVGPREQVSLDNGGDRIAHEAFTPRDDFDAWANERNDRAGRSAASRYVAPGVIGYEDLDDHGHWVHEVDYGYVWYPTRVFSGWAPYRYGHWVWISPWGWTWVDDAPWGFAPFHYGRWAHIRNRWCWVPGPIRVRAVYAPALVAWVGGPHVSVSVSFGVNVGWFPLGPREVYVPGYWHTRRYLHNVNYTNTVIVNNVIINRVYSNRSTYIPYSYRNYRDAITVTTREAFVRARPVANHIVNVRDTEIREWRTHNATPAIAPDRVSTLGARYSDNGARTAVRTPVSRAIERDVVVRRAPPPARATFEQERRAIEANDNRPVARRQITAAPREDAQPRIEQQRRIIERAPIESRSGGVRTDELRSGERRVNGPQRQDAPEPPEPRMQSQQQRAPRSESPRPESSRTESLRIDRAPRESAEEAPRRTNEVRRVERETHRAPNIVRQDSPQPAVRESYQRREPAPREWVRREAPQRDESQRAAEPRSSAPRMSEPRNVESRRYEAPQNSGGGSREVKQRGRDDSRSIER